MGFFSKLKKWWTGDKSEEAARPTPDQEGAAPLPRAASVPEAVPPTSVAPDAGAGPKPADPKPTEPVLAEPMSAEPVAEPSGPGPAAIQPWQAELTEALKGAEPRLSIWLGHTLAGVTEAGDELWLRLRFLFRSLETPPAEAEDFIARFRAWLTDMDYVQVEEFRSELQYRLALALELEDEEDERSRLFIKLSAGLAKTREQITRRIDQLVKLSGRYDEPFWEELEEILIMSDVGAAATQKLIERLKKRVRKDGATDTSTFKELLRDELSAIFPEPPAPRVVSGPEVVMVIGVNGVGKTTTIAKLSHRAAMQGRKVMMAAGDTFRAAAVEQLGIWAKRTGAAFYRKEQNADPAAVAFEALDAAVRENADLLLFDTAGRLHTKVDLMDELRKVKRVMAKKNPDCPHRVILVLDATTGQNALSQAKLFNEAVQIDEVVMTKLDGTAKGGILVALALEFGLPVSFIGLGEKMEDLRPFSGKDFAQALVD